MFAYQFTAHDVVYFATWCAWSTVGQRLGFPDGRFDARPFATTVYRQPWTSCNHIS